MVSLHLHTDWIGKQPDISVGGVALLVAPVVLSTLIASSHRLLEPQYRLGATPWGGTLFS